MFEGLSPNTIMLVFAVIIFTVSMVASYVPMVRKMSSRTIHLMIALAAGIFIGILFFMLLPETFHEGDPHDAGVWILIGFLAVLLSDVLIKHFHGRKCACISDGPAIIEIGAQPKKHVHEHTHEMTSASAFIGLAIHAAVDGMILGIGLSAGEEIGMAALIGISLHKFVELFSLSSTFLLTDTGKKRVLIYLLVFSLITPIAGFISLGMLDAAAEDFEMYIPLALAAGTFMYVGIYSLLPEAFHERKDSIIPFILVIVGVIAIYVITTIIGTGHVH
jgi:Predicted divalent heavy-metal cations transporter